MPSTVSGTLSGPATITFTWAVTLPTWVLAGQLSPFSWVTLQSGVAVGLPTRPGGRWTVRSFTWSAASLKPMWMLTSLCAPAARFDGWADSPWRPSAAWAAGARARQSQAVKPAMTAAPIRRRAHVCTPGCLTSYASCLQRNICLLLPEPFRLNFFPPKAGAIYETGSGCAPVANNPDPGGPPPRHLAHLAHVAVRGHARPQRLSAAANANGDLEWRVPASVGTLGILNPLNDTCYCRRRTAPA